MTLEDDKVQAVKDLGLGDNAETEQFVGDELDRQAATGERGAFKGWKLPPDVSAHDFFAIADVADKFAAIEGYRHYPTPKQMLDIYYNGMMHRGGEQEVYSYLAKLAGTDKTHPWSALGMTKKAYQAESQTFRDTYQELTGDELGDAHYMLHNNWSSKQYREFLMKDPTTNAKYGWIKHGMTYDQFAQYKVENKDKVIQRYGSNAGSNAQYLSLLDDPAIDFKTSAGTMTQQGISGQSQFTSGGVQSGGQSGVR